MEQTPTTGAPAAPLKPTADYRKKIVKALKAAGKYSASLEVQVHSLATALRSLDIADRDLDGLESTVVTSISRYGNESLAPHPVFKILKDTQDSITRQMKALGLTAEELAGADGDDPLYELTRQVQQTGVSRRVTLRPESD